MNERISIERSDRKTLTMRVCADGTIVVRAPLRTSDAEIQAFLTRHKRWIAARMREERHGLDLSFGAKIAIFGGVRTIAERTRAGLADGVLYLPREGKEEALVRLLKREVRSRAAALAERLAAEYGFRYSAVTVSSARTRWGTCNSKGKLAFSFRTAFLSDEQMRYIVAHELCHTRVFNHSSAFWHEVEKVVPNWKIVRKSVKSSGYIMRYL